MNLEGRRIAVWSEDAEDIAAAARILAEHGGRVTLLASLDELRRRLQPGWADLVVARLCPCCGPALTEAVTAAQTAASPPVVVLVDPWDKELYLAALGLWAFDGLALPVDERELLRIVSLAVEYRTLPALA